MCLKVIAFFSDSKSPKIANQPGSYSGVFTNNKTTFRVEGPQKKRPQKSKPGQIPGITPLPSSMLGGTGAKQTVRPGTPTGIAVPSSMGRNVSSMHSGIATTAHQIMGQNLQNDVQRHSMQGSMVQSGTPQSLHRQSIQQGGVAVNSQQNQAVSQTQQSMASNTQQAMVSPQRQFNATSPTMGHNTPGHPSHQQVRPKSPHRQYFPYPSPRPKGQAQPQVQDQAQAQAQSLPQAQVQTQVQIQAQAQTQASTPIVSKHGPMQRQHSLPASSTAAMHQQQQPYQRQHSQPQNEITSASAAYQYYQQKQRQQHPNIIQRQNSHPMSQSTSMQIQRPHSQPLPSSSQQPQGPQFAVPSINSARQNLIQKMATAINQTTRKVRPLSPDTITINEVAAGMGTVFLLPEMRESPYHYATWTTDVEITQVGSL